jgi:predicted Zn finger-like uncharacterized protein
MSGWRVECPHCATSSLLPDGLARAGARVRCPSCASAFVAADPTAVDARETRVRTWAEGRPGGFDGVRDDRASGRFWSAHGTSFLELAEADTSPEAWAAALARVLGPGPTLF